MSNSSHPIASFIKILSSPDRSLLFQLQEDFVSENNLSIAGDQSFDNKDVLKIEKIRKGPEENISL